MEKKEKIFVDGLMFKRPREGAPSFVKGSVSINIPRLREFIAQHAKGEEWINADLKEGQSGKLYFELNTWKKETPLSEEDKQTIQELRQQKQVVVDEDGFAIPF